MKQQRSQQQYLPGFRSAGLIYYIRLCRSRGVACVEGHKVLELLAMPEVRVRGRGEPERSMSKHTATPWYSDSYRIYGPTASADKRDGEILVDGKPFAATDADLQLMATAPGLQEACEAAFATFEAILGMGLVEGAGVRMMELEAADLGKVIAKATE